MPRARGPRIRFCEFCGHPFGPERGPAAKTCSPECERKRNAEKEKARYYKVRDSETWRAVRREYLDRLRERRASDPAFNAALRAAQREANARLRAAMRADPVRAAEYKARRQALRSAMTVEQRAAERATQRAWYASLSREDKVRIYYIARGMRALERMQAIGAELIRRAQTD